jgi:hypothetical protein
LGFLFRCKIINDTELLANLFGGFAWVEKGVPLIIVATLAQHSSINDLMSK